MRAWVNPVVLLCGMAGMFSASVQPPAVLPGEVRNPELADVDPSLRKGDRLALAANRVAELFFREVRSPDVSRRGARGQRDGSIFLNVFPKGRLVTYV